jgi:hypothetical protein
MLDSCKPNYVLDDVDGSGEWSSVAVSQVSLTPADSCYYELRAEQEIARALGSDDPRVSRAHYLLAGMYLDRLHGPQGG